MHIQHDQGFKSSSLKLGDFSSDDSYGVIQLLHKLLLVRNEAWKTVLLHGLFGLDCPVAASDTKHGLTLPGNDPLLSRSFGVVVMRLLNSISHRLEHDVLYLNQPVFDSTLACNWVDDSDELHKLSFD